MTLLKVGDKGKAACDTCKAFVTTTYSLKNVPFSDNSGVVANLLVGVCDGCESVVTLPHQSTPAVKEQLEQQRLIAVAAQAERTAIIAAQAEAKQLIAINQQHAA